MSINVLKEFMIHFHTFRNVDLINQGLYQIRSRIYYIDKNIKYYALPYFFIDSKEKEDFLMTEEQNIKPHNIISNHISENSSEYVTKTFLIRYSDEEVDIDEFCYFRIEIPFNNLKSDLMYNIEFELFFSDALMSINKEKKGNQNVLNNVEFKSVTTQVCLINFNGNGFIESFSPIVYSDSFSSTIQTSVHMIVLDYKLRMNMNRPYLIEEKNISTDLIQNKQENKINTNINKNTTKVLSSLIQFFLQENDCHFKLENTVIDQIYEKYVMTLIKNYFNLKDKYMKLMNKLLNEKLKSELNFFATIQHLNIYSDQKDKEEVPIINEENSNSFYNNLNLSSVANLSKRIGDFSSEYISARILLEINFIGGQIYQLWHKYVELIRYFPTQTNFILQSEHLLKYKESLNRFIKKSTVSITDSTNLLIPVESNIAEINSKNSSELRSYLTDHYIRPSVENLNHFIKPETFPILFEESYIKLAITNSYYNNSENKENLITKESYEFNHKNNNLCLHLIVLVHGFQGNAYDMRLIKNSLSLINPSCVFLPSNANQDDTECDIEEMGKKLANEVRTFVKEWNDGIIFKKISFIGHSIGGVIIRAALPHLKELSEKCWMYMSLSSPHLGYMYLSSKLIDAGMWLLKTWKKSVSLEQLRLSDVKDMKESCLYKLSEKEGLNWFSHVYLISSHQDLYAPYESTRIQLCSKSFDDTYKADIYRQMAYNILTKITKDSVKRVDVNFVITDKNLDSFIGRTAHIQFLENQYFMKILFYSIEDLLK